MQSVAGRTARDWRFGIEDIRCSLPWGEKTLQTVTRQVRSAEHRLVVAEKMASLAAVFCKQNYPDNDLQQAWDKTLWSQHHDSWITATTRSGREAWAFQVAAQTWDAEAVCTDIIERSLDNLTAKMNPAAGDGQGSFLHVFNTHAHDRHESVEIAIACASGTKAMRVRDAAGNVVASQFEITRKYVNDQADRVRSNRRRPALEPGESIGAARLIFRAQVPATGLAVYSVEDLFEEAAPAASPGASAVVQADESLVIETDLYRIRLDPTHGGAISSFFAKQLGKEFCAAGERRFHEFRGYFIDDKAWQTSTEKPATLEVLENGPLRVAVAIRGSIATVPFQTVISVVEGEPRIEFETQFRFTQNTWIGDPWEIPPAERMTGRRRSEYDDRPKLLALFPVQLKNQKLYKNAAFDVCRSENRDTFFQSWDVIKHNIIVDWVDVFDEESDMGLALFSDHTTSYVHGEDHPLAFVLGWGWDGGYWWGKCPLNGVQESRYAVIPHAKRWDKAQLWRHSTERDEPLLGRVSLSKQEATSRKLVRIDSPGVYLTTSYVDRGDLFLRLFNAESDNNEHEVLLGMHCKSIELVELDGRVSGKVRHTQFKNNGHRITVRIPRFGFRTLKLSQFV
jgi:alpha-mannosidase